jgi:AmmeMemoRadiSam system protein A
MTSEANRALLLRLAREAIEGHVSRAASSAHTTQSARGPGSSDVPDSGPNPHSALGNPQSDLPEALSQLCGAFVTLNHRGDLRGCIGHIEPNEPLGSVVPRCAVLSCSADPRFSPVTPFELDEIEIEISLLGPLEPVAGIADIVVGRHGLVVEQGMLRGLLLPQVATEWKWDAETFLAQTCRKAGLPTSAWKHGAQVFRFEAEVFGERR